MNLWPVTIGNNFAFENSGFVFVKLTVNADADKYKYSGYCTRVGNLGLVKT